MKMNQSYPAGMSLYNRRVLWKTKYTFLLVSQIRKNYKKYSVFGKPIFGEDKKIKNNYQFKKKSE